MKLFRAFAFVFVSLIGAYASAQARISIEAPDTLAFILSHNNEVINQHPVTAVTFIKGVSGKVTLKAEFPFRPALNFSQVITIKKNSEVDIRVERVKGAIKFVISGETQLTEPLFGILEGSQSDTLLVKKHTDGCFPVVDDQLYQEMLTTCNGIHFEAKKLECMTAFVSAHCLRVEQLRFMLSQLSQEDNKLQLLQAAQNIHDRSALGAVEEDFFLARNKEKVREIIR
jgi:hypothetical protein